MAPVVRNLENADIDCDYVVINDCSKDSTGKILDDNNINHIDLPVNLGLTGAVQTGYKYAYYNNYDAAIQFDGDYNIIAINISIFKISNNS